MNNYRKYLLAFLLVFTLPCVPVFAADLTITAGSVIPDDGFSFVDGVAGETLTAGLVVYLKASDSRYWKAHCETSSATATVAGITLNGASAGQQVRVMTGGTYTVGATVAVGKPYYLSTAGLIAPVDDLASSDWVSHLGIATSTTKMALRIQNSGVQKP